MSTLKHDTSGTSTELTGGAGFTFEDTVVAYYLAALLREGAAAGQKGIVTKVASQQAAQGEPLDDVIVDFELDGAPRRLSLQVKRRLTISGAPSNTDFREVVRGARETRAKSEFRVGLDAYGIAVEIIAADRLRSLNRLIDWAKSSPTGDEFAARFAGGGAAANAERELRDDLLPLINPPTPEREADFYRHLVTVPLAGLNDGGPLYAEIVTGLSEISEGSGSGASLFDLLCREARLGAGTAKTWTRASLLSDLQGKIRLTTAPSFAADISVLRTLASNAVSDISKSIDGVHVGRPLLIAKVHTQLAEKRFVNISGLPGCGKSAVLRSIAEELMASGPLLFIKSDRLIGGDWLSFAAGLGLTHKTPGALLAEIGATGRPILLVDGIDRIPPSLRNIVKDLLRTIEADPSLGEWSVLATSRDQGLEAFRSWIPVSFYRSSGIGDVAVSHFDDEEAERLAKERPALRRLLFGSDAVAEIARRPFFASVIAQSFHDDVGADTAPPRSEIDLISAWWAAGGYNAEGTTLPQRQRALLDLAETGAGSLGKMIPSRRLKPETIARIAELEDDRIVRTVDHGVTYSFAHDIFFEWSFYRLLMDLGSGWTRALVTAGEPPLLGRVVSLFSQYTIAHGPDWAASYGALESPDLRPQWRRAWLTGPTDSPEFVTFKTKFEALLLKDNHSLLEKFLVWFQAEHTMPSPLVLQSSNTELDGATLVRMADLLGWPSDFATWGRILDWLISIAPTLPVPLLPNILELFKVWQNVFADIKNARSTRILACCDEWLAEIETFKYRAGFSVDYGRWDALRGEALTGFESGLRFTLLRSARSHPEAAIAILDRAIANDRMRRSAYEELIGFSPILSAVAAEKLAALAKAELLDMLPMDKIRKEDEDTKRRIDSRNRIRAKPESERTEKESRILSSMPFIHGSKTYDLDDLGIDKYHQAYFPPSPLHEPFGSLFAADPKTARALVRDLANHAMEAWRQIHEINRRRFGTPIPLVLEFPWGTQRFWGSWPVYNWFKGQLGPQPLECAFLALSYWAHKQLDAGHPLDDLIRDVVEGHESWTVLGLAASLALEQLRASETVLPIATCQRLWHDDMARCVQEGSADFDPFGLNLAGRLTSSKASATEYLKGRKSRFRDVRALAPVFAISSDEKLRERFKSALARFPDDLPFELEEQRSNEAVVVSLRETAQRWAGLGDTNNYQATDAGEKIVIEYQPPTPLTAPEQARLESSTAALQEYSVLALANRSLEAGAPAPGMELEAAVSFVRARDSKDAFNTLLEAGQGAGQSAISATAACVIRFGGTSEENLNWAWDVMARVEAMREPDDFHHYSVLPWHPGLHLVSALSFDRRGSSPRPNSAQRLLQLALRLDEQVGSAAMGALLRDPDTSIVWVAAGLASDLFLSHAFSLREDGSRDTSANEAAQQKALEKAIERLESRKAIPLATPPPAWVKGPATRRFRGEDEDEDAWQEPTIHFAHHIAERIVKAFPVEAWCQSEQYRPLFLNYLEQLVTWTAARLNPEWEEEAHRRRQRARADLNLWPGQLADLMARASPYADLDTVREKYLKPFVDRDDEEGLAVIAEFAEMMVCRHVFDADQISDHVLAILGDCLGRLLDDRVFRRGNYRAGELHGFDLPRLVKSLLFVSVTSASGAKRYANGDWSDLARVMPLVSRLVAEAGWAPYVMDAFMALCERAGGNYPLQDFADQIRSVLSGLESARDGWVGTMLPARISGMVQLLADANFPLTLSQAQSLLVILDALIDLGDRRSAALEQSETFRTTQTAPSESRGIDAGLSPVAAP